MCSMNGPAHLCIPSVQVTLDSPLPPSGLLYSPTTLLALSSQPSRWDRWLTPHPTLTSIFSSCWGDHLPALSLPTSLSPLDLSCPVFAGVPTLPQCSWTGSQLSIQKGKSVCVWGVGVVWEIKQWQQDLGMGGTQGPIPLKPEVPN